MLDYLLLETTVNSVSGEFSFAIKAVDEAYYADNSVSGTGEYEGWLIFRKCFTLEHRNTPYCIECSTDGVEFHQMRICHLFKGADEVVFGVYACSPGQSSFRAVFTEMEVSECKWKKYGE